MTFFRKGPFYLLGVVVLAGALFVTGALVPSSTIKVVSSSKVTVACALAPTWKVKVPEPINPVWSLAENCLE